VNKRLPHLPDDQSLATGLSSALAGAECVPVTVVDRMVNPNASTFPSEVVTCRLGDGTQVRLLCKYGGHDHPAYGHRGGVGYEAEVYRRVLAAAALPVPRFYGAAAAGPAGNALLAIEYLEYPLRLNDTRDLIAWEQAAVWSGHFHARHEVRSRDPALSFLIDYDAEYYAGWPRRTAEHAATLHPEFPWLADLCRRSETALLGLLEAPPTVIHGEYYPKNILLKEGNVYPVDWESAAHGCGEIDMATLTDRCEPDVVIRCEAAYRRARWPNGVPTGFTRTLELARLYVHFRWLGAPPGPKSRRRVWRYEEVQKLGQRIGLI